MWVLGKNTMSKTAILAGKSTAWSESGGGGVLGEEEEEGSELGDRMHLRADKDG